jgi:hypothetical protein
MRRDEDLAPSISNGWKAGKAVSVGRGKRLGLLHLHGLVVAVDLALAGLDAEDLSPADFAGVPLSQKVGHGLPPHFMVRGWPWQVRVPEPALVTTNSEPQMAQK